MHNIQAEELYIGKNVTISPSAVSVALNGKAKRIVINLFKKIVIWLEKQH
jgi:hypothetical protein